MLVLCRHASGEHEGIRFLTGPYDWMVRSWPTSIDLRVCTKWVSQLGSSDVPLMLAAQPFMTGRGGVAPAEAQSVAIAGTTPGERLGPPPSVPRLA